MGVPYIESTGPYERKLSPPLSCCADYVTGEDTDILIYGAPLLRNITSRNKALLLISCSESAETNLDCVGVQAFEGLEIDEDNRQRCSESESAGHNPTAISQVGRMSRIITHDPRTSDSNQLQEPGDERKCFQY
ncbi:hypothetical protein V8E52_011625 [Russula decolorans]